MPRLVVNVSEDLMAALDRRSEAEDRERDRVVRRALNAYLATNEGVVGNWPPPVEHKAEPTLD